MKRFRRDASGNVTARFEGREAGLLSQLALDTADLLTSSDGSPATRSDPALLRLLPDAYPDDSEASEEFRRFTSEGLIDRKILNAQIMSGDLMQTPRASDKASTTTTASRGGRVTVTLDPDGVQAWLRTLTDIRLVLASRLGIETDGDLGFRGGAENRHRAIVYGWVGYVQESLIRALNSPPRK